MHDPADPGIFRRVAIIGNCGPAHQFSECRVRRHKSSERLHRHFLRDGQGQEIDDLAGLSADDVRAEQPTTWTGDQLEAADRLALRPRPVVAGIVGPENPDLVAMAAAGFRLAQADMAEFRRGIGDPGNEIAVFLRRQAEQNGTDHQAGMIAGHMGELQAAGDVADGVDPAIAGAQAPVDLDALSAVGNTRLFQIQTVDGGCPAGCHEQMRSFQRALDALGRFDADAHTCPRLFNAGDLRVLQDRYPFGAQGIDHDRGLLRIVLAERFLRLDHGHLAAEAAVRLGHFHTDRPAADDDQVLRRLPQVEQGFIGQIRHRVETGDRRHGRTRPGGDDEPPRADFRLSRQHAIGFGETGMVLEDGNPQTLEAFFRIMRGNGRDNGLDMIVCPGEIDSNGAKADTKFLSRGFRHGCLRRCEQRL